MDRELSFCLKVLRNALILSVLYLVSVWSATDLELDWKVIKPVMMFALTYIGTELVKYYKLDVVAAKRNTKKSIKVYSTLIY